MPLIKINDQEYEVEAGQNLIQAAASVGIDIPHYCYHPGLSVSGNCRMCLVQMESPRGTMATIACNTVVGKPREGQEDQPVLTIHTDTPEVEKMRKGVMEFLLLNHPIDCPICDQAGECGLQDYYMDYARYSNRSTVPKVEKKKVVDVGPLVKLDQERCILCSRCVRFCEEVTQTNELVIAQRGEKNCIETFPGIPLDNPYSVNVVDLCPVGALTSKDFRFKKRVWFLDSADSICTGCSRGCNIELDHEGKKVYRYRPRTNMDVNQYWMCDAGRLSYKSLNENRLETPLHKGEPVTYEAALEAVHTLLKAKTEQDKKQSVLALGSAESSVEDNFMLKQLSAKAFSETAFAPVLKPEGESDALLRMADQTPNRAGVSFLGFDTDAAALEEQIRSQSIECVVVLNNTLNERIQALLEEYQITVIYLGTHRDALALKAEYAFPVTTHAEHYGSYVNADNRLQKVNRAYDSDFAVPAWRVAQDIFSPLLSAPPLYDDVEDLWSGMRTAHAELKQMTFYEIPEEGFVLETEAPASEEEEPSV